MLKVHLQEQDGRLFLKIPRECLFPLGQRPVCIAITTAFLFYETTCGNGKLTTKSCSYNHESRTPPLNLKSPKGSSHATVTMVGREGGYDSAATPLFRRTCVICSTRESPVSAKPSYTILAVPDRADLD